MLDRSHPAEHQPRVKHQEKDEEGPHDHGQRQAQDQQEAVRIRHVFVHGLLHCRQLCCEHEDASEYSVDHQQEEELVVSPANAIHDPGTMVVHPEDAELAEAAMVTPIRLVLQAPLAMPPLTRELNLACQGQLAAVRGPAHAPLRRVWSSSWICKDCTQKADEQHRGEKLRDDCLLDSTTLGFLILEHWHEVQEDVHRPDGDNVPMDKERRQNVGDRDISIGGRHH